MSLSGIFDPIVRAYFEGQSDGSSDTGVIALVWHNTGQPSETGVYKLSDITPPASKLENAKLLVRSQDQAGNSAFGGSVLIATDYGTMTTLAMEGTPDTFLAIITYQETDGMAPGFYLNSSVVEAYTDCWIIWEEGATP